MLQECKVQAAVVNQRERAGLLTGGQKKIDVNKDGVIDGKDLSMLRAKMAMPKMVDSSNFPKMAQEMAMAMDYNSSKPMMYGGDKPKMMSKDGKHTGKVVNIGGKNYDTSSSEYKALQKKIQKQEKQEVQIKGGRYTGRSQSGTTQMS